MAEEHLEREVKFDVPDGWRLPAEVPLAPEGGTVRASTLRLDSTYFDTREHDLLRHGVTLRRRTGDDDTGWHLKVPSGADRNELRLPLDGADSPPAELVALVRGLTSGRDLVPVATLHTERHVHFVVSQDGRRLAEIADDEVTASVDEDGSSWHEVEVELHDGDDALLSRAAAWLRKTGAYPASSGSKLARAFRSDALAPHSDATLGNVVAGYLHDQHRAMVAGDVDLRRGVDAIHRTRVATRRYRSVLRVFADLFEPQRASALDAELKWYAERLGKARDIQVMRAHLREQAATLPTVLLPSAVAAHVDRALDAADRHAWDEIRAVLDGDRYAELLRDVRSCTEDVRTASARPQKDVADYVHAANRKAHSRLRDAGRKRAEDEQRHRARKAEKRARYAAELAVPVLGKEAVRAVARAKALQDELGALQDAVVASDFLRELAAHDTEIAFALGVLWESEQRRAARARKAAKRAARKG